jgi:hypothetical protein
MNGTWHSICPMFKKGEKSECHDYGGISLLTIVYKVLAAAMNNRPAHWAKDLGGEY